MHDNSRNLPKSVFPYRCVSQRLTLEYDEIDDLMDVLFDDLFNGEEKDEPRTKDTRQK